MRKGRVRVAGGLAAAVALSAAFAGAARAADDAAPDPQKELERAKELIASGRAKAGNLVAGDAYRTLNQYAQAVACYQKVLPTRRRRMNQPEKSALAGLGDIEKAVLEAIDQKRLGDGTFTSSSVGYVGPVHVTVIVKEGRIHSVKVDRHRESRPRTAVRAVPNRIVKKGDVRGVDVVTGASFTSRALLKAATYALAGAIRPPDNNGDGDQPRAPN